MTSILNQLKKTINNARPKTLYGRANIVGEVLAYDEKTIKVKVLGGYLDGEEMDIVPNKPVKEFSKESKAQTSSYTPIGGILRFDNVTKNADGTYKSTWVNAWIKNPGDEHHLLTDQAVSFHDTGRVNADDRPIMTLRVMDLKSETKVNDIEALESKLAEALEANRGALIIDTTEGYTAAEVYLPGRKTEAGYEHDDPKEYAAKIIADMGEEVIEAAKVVLADHGMTVVPMSVVPLGAKSAEEIKKKKTEAEAKGEKARIMTINPYAYEAPSIGVRIAGALARKDRDGNLDISSEFASRLKEKFLASAPEAAKAALHANGWKGVGDDDLRNFFKANGVELIEAPTRGWNTAAIHMQRYEGGTNFFAAKTHEAYRFASPYPALECCKELRTAFGSELTDAIKEISGAPAAKADAKAPEAAAGAEAPAAASQTQEMDQAQAESEIDDLLADVDNLPMS